MNKTILAIVATTAVSACATNEPVTSEPVNAASNNSAIIKDETPAFTAADMERPYSQHVVDYGRGGAAIREENRYHVLDNPLVADPAPTKDDLGDRYSGVGTLNFYEIQSWERYCAGGKDFTGLDVVYLRNASTAEMPPELAPTCEPPEFTYQEYEFAWIRACSNATLTDEQKAILAIVDSTPPNQYVDPERCES